MNEEHLQAEPQTVRPEPEPVAAPAPKPKSKAAYLMAGGLFLAALAAVFALYVRYNADHTSPVAVSPTPTMLPTPIPPQNLSPVATTSAFAAFHSAVSSLSGALNGFALQDPALTPPILNTVVSFGP